MSTRKRKLLEGGGNKYSYLVSLGYQRETGLPKYGHDTDKRYYVKAKTDIDLLKNLKFDLNIGYDVSNRYLNQILNLI